MDSVGPSRGRLYETVGLYLQETYNVIQFYVIIILCDNMNYIETYVYNNHG